MYQGLKAFFNDNGSHCLCLAPVGPGVFTPHGGDLELRGVAPTRFQDLIFSEETEPKPNV